MARYKYYSYEQGQFIPVQFDRQILPETFEMDVSVFEGRIRNDETGEPAYDPRILLKIVFYGYARGIITSRDIEARQVCKFEGRDDPAKHPTFSGWMRERMDSVRGRYLYSRRMGIVEPVFANICARLGLNRFTLRGKTKVDAQWKMYAMVHNMLKIYRYGWGGTG